MTCVTNVEFIPIIHFYLFLFHVLYLMSNMVFYIVYELGVLGVVQKIQVMSSLQDR